MSGEITIKLSYNPRKVAKSDQIPQGKMNMISKIREMHSAQSKVKDANKKDATSLLNSAVSIVS